MSTRQVIGNKPAFTLWQLPEQTNSQMSSYVIKTSGNEVIVIDGGTKGDAAYLLKFIGGIGNHVNAWFISHPHLDHVDALTKILNDKSDITIDVLYASLLDDKWLKKNEDSRASSTQKALKAALKKSNYKLLELSLGQKIEFKGITLEVLGVWNPELTFNAVNNNPQFGE